MPRNVILSIIAGAAGAGFVAFLAWWRYIRPIEPQIRQAQSIFNFFRPAVSPIPRGGIERIIP